MITLTEKNVAIADSYYKAMIAGDLDRVATHLHANVRLIGPLGDLSGKQAVLTAVDRFATLMKSLTIRAAFGSEDSAVLMYDVDFDSPIGVCRTAVLMNFHGKSIVRIELFYDARPFEKYLKKGSIS